MRLEIDPALKSIKRIGKDVYKQNIIFENYIQKIKKRLINNK